MFVILPPFFTPLDYCYSNAMLVGFFITKVVWCMYVRQCVTMVCVMLCVSRLLCMLCVCGVCVKRYHSSLISSCMSTVVNPFRVRELTGDGSFSFKHSSVRVCASVWCWCCHSVYAYVQDVCVRKNQFFITVKCV